MLTRDHVKHSTYKLLRSLLINFKPTAKKKNPEQGLICKKHYAVRFECAVKETEDLEAGKFTSQKLHTIQL